MHRNDLTSFTIRYVSLLIIGLSNLFLAENGIFYAIFTPLTVYPVYGLLQALYGATLIAPTIIFIKGYYASIIPACIAGSAYYFLVILNLSTPMKKTTRIASLTFIIGTFLVLNIFRITLFSTLLFKGYQYFDLAHLVTWYFGSTLFVILIWFANVLVFRIKSVPIYTDLMSLVKDLRAH